MGKSLKNFIVVNGVAPIFPNPCVKSCKIQPLQYKLKKVAKWTCEGKWQGCLHKVPIL
jgi:hypothetical protein